MKQTTERRFDGGQLVATHGALDEVDPQDMAAALGRHFAGDWGECGPEDWGRNDEALQAGWRLLSVYRDRHGTRFWVITEADRSATTVLLPDEY